MGGLVGAARCLVPFLMPPIQAERAATGHTVGAGAVLPSGRDRVHVALSGRDRADTTVALAARDELA